MNRPIDTFIDALERKTGKRGERKGRNYVGHSPTRDERTPSLNISESVDGTVLLYDFGGSTFSEIVGALNISPSDLFPPKDRGEGNVVPLRRKRPESPRTPAHLVAMHRQETFPMDWEMAKAFAVLPTPLALEDIRNGWDRIAQRCDIAMMWTLRSIIRVTALLAYGTDKRRTRTNADTFELVVPSDFGYDLGWDPTVNRWVRVSGDSYDLDPCSSAAKRLLGGVACTT